jgi:hypothetical protein
MEDEVGNCPLKLLQRKELQFFHVLDLYALFPITSQYAQIPQVFPTEILFFIFCKNADVVIE